MEAYGEKLELTIHQFLPHTRTNGPGMRAAVWVQGCTLGCPGCFNPETHSPSGGEQVSVDALFDRIAALGDSIQGITLSGGEPFQQLPALTALLRRVREETALSIVVFTGFTLAELSRFRPAAPTFNLQPHPHTHTPIHPLRGYPPHTPSVPEALAYIDVLIAGRYDETQRVARDLRGSRNKEFHFLTDRYTASDFREIPEAEVILGPDGTVTLTGIDPVRW
jgi:anaerobic ribonucleoside-triphosphate reductase activating protein